MIKCLVTDDEEHAAETIANYIKQTPSLELAGIARNGMDAIDFINKNEVNLLFLDIRMPGISGIDVLKIVDSTPVILTTAFKQYTMEGFEHGVVDYLLKPISYPRFLKAVNRLIARQKEKIIDRPAETPATLKEKDHLFIKAENGKLIRINFADIDFVEGARNYVYFHCGQSKYLNRMNIKEAEALLPKHLFVRIHKSHIVAVDKISIVQGNLLTLKKSNGMTQELLISPIYKDDFMERINS